MKSLTFYCLACRRSSHIEVPPVLCLHCGSGHGIIRRGDRAAAASNATASNATVSK